MALPSLKTPESANWDTVLRFLPRGWQRAAYDTGAIQRAGKIHSPELLLRIMFLHLADGCSLRETSARASQAGWVTVSDVALLKRLRRCSEWFRWMAIRLLHRYRIAKESLSEQPAWLSSYRVYSVDATSISEPGSTGTDWRLHYGIDLFTLACNHFRLTPPSVGESFSHLVVHPGDLLVADRGYVHFSGFAHVKRHGGDFLVRYKPGNMHLADENGERFDILRHVSSLQIGEVGEWFLRAGTNKHALEIPVRLCAIRKSEEAAEQAIKKTIASRKRKGRGIHESSLALQRYVLILTSLRDEDISPHQLFKLYCVRWQIELAFKRLKSIMGLGHLPKEDIESGRAWLHGKLLISLIVQAMVDSGRLFSPWGYPLAEAR